MIGTSVLLFPLKSIEIRDDFRKNTSHLICLKLLNIRSEIRWKFLNCGACSHHFNKKESRFKIHCALRYAIKIHNKSLWQTLKHCMWVWNKSLSWWLTEKLQFLIVLILLKTASPLIVRKYNLPNFSVHSSTLFSIVPPKNSRRYLQLHNIFRRYLTEE